MYVCVCVCVCVYIYIHDCGSNPIRRYVNYGFDKSLRDDGDDNDNIIYFVPLNTRVHYRTTYRIFQGWFWLNAIAGVVRQYFPDMICKKHQEYFI
jgi:hypothetical protein